MDGAPFLHSAFCIRVDFVHHAFTLLRRAGRGRRRAAGPVRPRAGRAGAVRHDFSAAKLTALPTTSWPTNGGNLYNQRYSPLKAINRENVDAAQRRVADASARVGHRTAVLGLCRAARVRRRRLREYRRQRRVCPVDRQRRDPLAVRSEARPEHHLGLLRLEQQGCRDQRGQGLHRAPRRPARGARSRDGEGRVVDPGRALAGELLDHRRAALRRGPVRQSAERDGGWSSSVSPAAIAARAAASRPTTRRTAG